MHALRLGVLFLAATIYRGWITQVWGATVTDIPQGCSPALARRCTPPALLSKSSVDAGECRENQRE